MKLGYNNSSYYILIPQWFIELAQIKRYDKFYPYLHRRILNHRDNGQKDIEFCFMLQIVRGVVGKWHDHRDRRFDHNRMTTRFNVPPDYIKLMRWKPGNELIPHIFSFDENRIFLELTNDLNPTILYDIGDFDFSDEFSHKQLIKMLRKQDKKSEKKDDIDDLEILNKSENIMVSASDS